MLQRGLILTLAVAGFSRRLFLFSFFFLFFLVLRVPELNQSWCYKVDKQAPERGRRRRREGRKA